ncbi:hypothetical protein [Leptospira santarosai]|uniref:hypothetical protein n=1 Tax=Leptospira santarosai TaxID=28183 RepID=UPI0012DAABBD|nr:hypothetical protein [Leptospira santarosai]
MDPSGLYVKDNLQTIKSVEKLLKGETVVQSPNFSTRLLHKELIKRNNNPCDIVIIGTSRVHNINSRTLPNFKLMNHGLGAATLFDLIGIVQTYLKKKKSLPKIVLIGVDEWLFHEKRTKNIYQWEIFASEIDQYLKNQRVSIPIEWANWFYGSRKREFWLRLKTIMSFQYLKDSLQQYLIENNKVGTQTLTDETVTLFPDGHMEFPFKMRNRTQDEVDSKLNQTINYFQNYTLADFNSLGHFELELFYSLIQTMIDNGITPVFFLSPHHHSVFEYMSKRSEGKKIKDVEMLLRKYAKEKDILIIGSYDPYQVPCGSDEYMDEHHMKESCYERIFKTLSQDLAKSGNKMLLHQKAADFEAKTYK